MGVLPPSLSAPYEAERAASEALSIVFDVFQSRGETPLSVKCRRGERARHEAVHSSLTPEDFIKLALEAGFRAARLPQEHGTPVIALARGHFRSVALLRSPVPDTQLFASVLFRAIVRGSGRRSARHVGRAHGVAPAKLIEDGDGTVWAQMELVFDGGVAAAWIIRSLERWRAIIRECERVVKVPAKRGSGEPNLRSTPSLLPRHTSD